MPNRLGRQAFPLFSATIPAGFFLVLYACNRFIYSYDTTNLFYVTKRWFWSQVWAGHLPLWNENLFGGFFALASPANGFTSPVSALFYSLIPSVLAEELQLPLFAALAGLGMFTWLKRWTSPQGAMLAALTYALSGPLLSLTDRSHIFYSVCLYPWAFLWFDRVVEKRRGAIGMLALVLAMIVIHADWVAACILILLFVTLALGSGEVVGIVISAVWALGLSLLAFLPAVLNVGDTTRAAGFTLEQTSYYSFHPLRLISFILPEAWGQPYDHTFYGGKVANAYLVERFWYHSIYLSLPILLLALGGLRQVRRVRYGVAGLGIALGFLLLAFGQHFALHPFLYHILPGYAKLRYPEKFLLYAEFAAFPLAAVTASRIVNWRPWLLGIALLHLVGFSVPYLWPEMLKHTSLAPHFGHLVLALILLFMAWRSWGLSWLTAVAVLELLLYAPALSTLPSEAFAEPSSFLTELGEGRFVRDGNLNASTSKHPQRGLEPNWPMLAGRRDVFGYESVISSRQERLTGAALNLEAWAPVLNITHVVSTISPRAPDLKRLSLLGLLDAAAMDREINSVLLSVHRKSKDFDLICRYQAFADDQAAFAFVSQRLGTLEPLAVERNGILPEEPSDCGEHSVILQQRSSEQRLYQVTTQAPMWLVERETYDPGWKAFIDGHEAALWHVDFAGRGLPVPPGQHRIEMRFEPRGLTWATWITAISFFALLVYLSIWAKSTIPQLIKST